MLKQGVLIWHHVLFGVGCHPVLVGQLVMRHNVPTRLAFTDSDFVGVMLASLRLRLTLTTKNSLGAGTSVRFFSHDFGLPVRKTDGYFFLVRAFKALWTLAGESDLILTLMDVFPLAGLDFDLTVMCFS
jgi:hypothetical protein